MNKAIKDLDRIANAVEKIAKLLGVAIDPRKRTVRTVDVERGKVYKTHLGKKLSK